MTDRLQDRVKAFDRGEKPSPFGELRIVLPRGPVSQQAKRAEKDKFAEELREHLTKYAFLLTGDVQIDIEWLVHERVRYENAGGADVDNILKPLLDALTGPNGILIDDCQVQHVACRWIDWSREDEEQITIEIQHPGMDWLPRGSLAFVDIGGHLYMPVITSWPDKARQSIVEILERAVEFRDKAEAEGVEFQQARLAMPMQRAFHRSRIDTSFPTGSLEDFRRGVLKGL